MSSSAAGVARIENSLAANVAPVENNGVSIDDVGGIDGNDGSRKRTYGESYRFKDDGNKRFKNKSHRVHVDKAKKQGSGEEVLLADVRALLAKQSLEAQPSSREPSREAGDGEGAGARALPEPFTEIDLAVSEISSTGDGLALHPGSSQVYVVPFTAPGDTVTAKVIKHFPDESYSLADFVKIVKPSQYRDDSLIKCPYFATCGGCQFQMLPYHYQLAHKKTIVEKAYRNFSNLPPELVPEVGDTIGSPLQYGYRTKLTPHFDGPPGGRRDRRNGVTPRFKEVPPIGFMKKGTRHTMDIEDCPIGTDIVRMGLKRERTRVAAGLDKYPRGATLLLRENTERIPKTPGDGEESGDSNSPDTIYEDRGPYVDKKTCVTDSKTTTTEYIDDFIVTNPAGAFFQNNNSILPEVTSYIRSHIVPLPPGDPPITNLIDAYSGSGLFTITLSKLFSRSLGIDCVATSIRSATENARLNGIPENKASFIAADATRLFENITFPAERTAVVIDPPRKGCGEAFIKQLLEYGPARIVYVSCNVHSQARDVGFLVGGMKGVDGGLGVGEGVYEMESLRGFDFFPQTGHVEVVAVLNKREAKEKGEMVERDGKDGEGMGAKVEAEAREGR